MSGARECVYKVMDAHDGQDANRRKKNEKSSFRLVASAVHIAREIQREEKMDCYRMKERTQSMQLQPFSLFVLVGVERNPTPMVGTRTGRDDDDDSAEEVILVPQRRAIKQELVRAPSVQCRVWNTLVLP
jgi:hypothetical protein